MPTTVKQRPATRLGHGLMAGLSAAMTNATTASRIPGTMDNHAKARTQIAYKALAKPHHDIGGQPAAMVITPVSES